MFVSVGLVLGAEKLKPISWSEWAGQVEREGGARNPYRNLEERYGFWDIRVSVAPHCFGIIRASLDVKVFEGLMEWSGS